jgi:hypothetical protein
MAYSYNPVTRVLNIISAAQAYRNQNDKAIDAWAHVLQVDSPDAIMRRMETISLLRLIYLETERGRALMGSIQLSRDLYDDAFSAVNRTLDVELFPHAWQSVIGLLTPTALNALKICSELLPTEGEEIAATSLEHISKLVAELRTDLASGNVPRALREYLDQQLTIIERAIRSYPIVGNVAFTQAVSESLTVAYTNKTTAKEHASSVQVRRFTDIWREVLEVSESTRDMIGDISSEERGMILLPGKHE